MPKQLALASQLALFNMDGGGPTPTTGSKRFPRSQKLKDTCDMCSASKVRCNKEKPICSRCEQLGYPCFYSPARRMGRPHPPKRTASQNRVEVAGEPPERQPINRPTHESIESESNVPPNVAQTSLEHETQEQTTNKRLGSEVRFNSDAVLDFHRSAISLNGQLKSPPTDLYTRKKVRQQEHGEDTAMFNFYD